MIKNEKSALSDVDIQMKVCRLVNNKQMMKNKWMITMVLACFCVWARAGLNQVNDLVSQNFDDIVLGTTNNVAADGTITFTSSKWTNDESAADGTCATWNKLYSSQIMIAKDASENNTTNYITSSGNRLTVLFTPQTSGAVVFEARVKTPATAGSSGFISLDDDPSATSTSAVGRSNLIYFNTTTSGTSSISYNGSTQLLVSGLVPATWYYIRIVYYITGDKAGKWDMYYGKDAAKTLITSAPVAYQSSASAYALQRLYMSGPFSIDDIRVYQPTVLVEPPTASVSLSVEGGIPKIGKSITGSYIYHSSASISEKESKWLLVESDDDSFSSDRDTLDMGTSANASTFSLPTRTLTVSDAYKYIRLEVIPMDSQGYEGCLQTSPVLGPVLDVPDGCLTTVIVDNELGAPQYTTGGTPGGWGTLTFGQLVGKNQTRAYKGGVAGDIYGDYALYKPDLSSTGAGYYRVKVVSVVSGSPFLVDIHHAKENSAGQYTDEAPITVTPHTSGSEWVDLGYYYFSGDGTETVKLSTTSTSATLRTDAVSFSLFGSTATDNRLLSLSTDKGTLSQSANAHKGFECNVTEYTLLLPPSTASYTVTALKASENATMKINGQPLSNFTPSASIPFGTTATVEVTNNGVTRVYTIKPFAPAQSVANSMILFEPLRDAASSFSVLPPVNADYTATITATSPSGIIRMDGTLITRPSAVTDVNVTVQVKSKTNSADVATKTLQVRVKPTYVAPVGDLAAAQAAFSRKKKGLFIHYVPYLTAGKSGVINDINVLADNFDAAQVAQDAADFGAEYVVFTAWHARALPLFPSRESKRWRDDRRSVAQMQTYSNRDVIGDLISALKAKNIDLLLYIHPTDGHDFKDGGVNDNLLQDQTLTGYTDATNNYACWNQYVNELLDEMCERYGDGIKGFWIDGGAPHIDIPRLRRTLRAYNPTAVIIENVGGNRGADVTIPGVNGLADYNCWEVSNVSNSSLGLLAANADLVKTDGKTWPGYIPQVALVIGNGWWAKTGNNISQYSAKDLYLYNVLLASVSKSGGLLYSTGCAAGKASDYSNGNIWDGAGGGGDIYATLKAVNAYIKPVEESIKNTNVSKAYPSISTACSWLQQYQWGVSTESADGKYVYLHVVNPPEGKTLSIGEPADGSSFILTAKVLNTQQQVDLVKTSTGYDITLPESASWDAVNTVIRLERSSAASSSVYIHNIADNASWTNVETTADGKIKVIAADKIEDIPAACNWYFAPGTYTLPVGESSINNQKMYGGFTGQESTVDETVLSSRKRTDVDGNGLVEKWEFANRVYLQRGESLPATAEDAYLTLLGGSELDGVTIRNINSSNAYALRVGAYISTPATAVPSSNAGTLRNCIVQNISAPGLVDISDYSDMDGCLIENSTVTGATGVFMPGYQCKMRNTKCRNIDMTGSYVYFAVPQIAMDGATPTIENCIFHNITTGKNNYGVIRTMSTSGTSTSYVASNIVNCTFSNNSSGNVIEFIGTSGNVANCLINANTSSIRANSSTATVKAYNCVSNKPFSAASGEGSVNASDCYSSATISFSGTIPAAAGYVATTATDYSKVVGSTFSINGYPSDGTTTYYGTGVAGSINVPTTDIMGYAQLNGKYTVGAFNPLTILSENSAANTGSFVDGIAGRVVVSRTLKTGQWGTVYLPLNMTAEQVASIFGTGTKLAAYDETGSTATKLNFKTVAAAALTANIPYIIYPAQDVNNFTLTDVTMVKQTGTPSIGNDKFSFIGSYDKAPYTGNECWYIANGNVVKKLADGGTLQGLSCHFERTTSGAKDLIFTVDDESTGINNISTDEMKTGDGRIYNILGQQVNSDYRGVVIRNGKKFIKK